MMTYIIEVGVPGMPFWELEKVRANSLSEAKAYLREIYGRTPSSGIARRSIDRLAPGRGIVKKITIKIFSKRY